MILFFVEGTGLGHAARVWYAAKALSSPVITFGKAVEFLRERGVEVYSLEKPYTLHFGDRGLDVLKSIASVLTMDVAELKRITTIVSKADLVVVDSSILGVLLAVYHNKPFLYIGNSTRVDAVYTSHTGLTQTLLDRLLSKAKALVVPDFPPPFTITRKNLHLPLHHYLFLGPTVYVNDIPLGNESMVVVNMGAGFEVSPLELPFPAVVPKGFKAKGGKVVENVRPYMGYAKAVITHGGHSTIMEALSLSKPLIVVPNLHYPERINNADGVVEQGVGVRMDHPTPEGLRMALDHLKGLKRNVRVFSKAYRRMKGYRRLVEVVEGLL